MGTHRLLSRWIPGVLLRQDRTASMTDLSVFKAKSRCCKDRGIHLVIYRSASYNS